MSISEKQELETIENKNDSLSQGYDSEIASADDFNIIDIDRSKAGSTWMAYVNIVCVVIGTGILGLPMALKQGGWIGLLILFLAWGMSVYTAIILIRCLYANGKARLTTYKEVATAAFGWIGGWVTFFFNAWILVGGPVLYLVLCGQNINQICKGTVAELGDLRWTIISCAIAAVPFILLKSMKEVAWISALGVVATFIVVFIVLIMSALDKPNQVNVHHDSVNWNMFPIALSTIAFSFGGNVIYPHIEASMKRPKSWPKVAVGGLSSCGAMYLIVAVCGYAIYGSEVASPVYNSIPEGTAQTVAIIVITINILVSSPIYATSFALDVEEMCNITVERLGKLKEFLFRAMIRLFIIAVITVVGCTVPHFGALMSLIGAFGNCTLVLIFPVIFYLKLTGVRNKPIYELIWCASIILLGLVGLIFGTMEAIKELAAVYSS